MHFWNISICEIGKYNGSRNIFCWHPECRRVLNCPIERECTSRILQVSCRRCNVFNLVFGGSLPTNSLPTNWTTSTRSLHNKYIDMTPFAMAKHSRMKIIDNAHRSQNIGLVADGACVTKKDPATIVILIPQNHIVPVYKEFNHKSKQTHILSLSSPALRARVICVFRVGDKESGAMILWSKL